MMRYVSRTRRGNQPRERLPRDSCTWEIDDVRIAEQVVQERPDAFQGIRSTELKENHPQLHNV